MVGQRSLTETGALSHLWMMHDKIPDPIKGRPKNPGAIGTSTFYEPMLPNQ